MQSADTSVALAQKNMREAYYAGAPGMAVSATVWLIAGLIALYQVPKNAVWGLYLGAMFIHPLAVVLSKVLGRSGNHAAGNPLAPLAIANTLWLMLSLPMTYIVFLFRQELFFPAMMLIIGGRFLTFAPLYGLRTYWACGATLALGAFALVALRAPFAIGAFSGGAIELAFAIVIFHAHRREHAA